MTSPRASGQGMVMRMAAALALTLGCLLAAAATGHAASRQTALGTPGLVAASDDGSTATVFSAGRSVRIPARRAQAGHGFTVELWAYLLRYGDTGRSRKVASRGGQAVKSNWQLALAAGTRGRVTYSFGDGTRTVARVSHANLALGRWYQLAFVHVPQRRIELYVNGALDSKLRTSAQPVAAAAPIVLGGDRHGSSARYDALALYERALAAREIRAQFASASVGAAGVTPALVPAFMQAAASGFAPPVGNGVVPDTTPPDTTIVDRPPDPTNDATPTFQLRASEAGSTFGCRLDGGSWHACGSTWTTSALGDGRHALAARATDAAGNADPTPASASFTVDTTPPDTAVDSAPSGTVGSAGASVAFSSPDAGTHFECSADGGGWSACSSPYELTGLADGPHGVAVRAIDTAGNVDPTPAAVSWSVDTTAPSTSIDSGPSGATRDSTPTFAFSSPDAGAHYSCRLDTGAWAACTSPYTTGALGDGPHVLSVRATDATGNDDPSPASRGFTVDTVAPNTAFDTAPSGTVNATIATLGFSATESGATLECKLDGGSWSSCSSPYMTGTLADGSHSFSVRATDAAGNVDATPATAAWTVDATAPDTSIDSGPSGPTADSTPTFAFSSPDASARFVCRIDSGAWAACSSPYTTSALGEGPHTIAVRATDPAGNDDPTPATRGFTVDTAAPDTSIDSAPSGTVNDRSATVAFSSPDSTASFDCRIDGGTWAACASPVSYSALASGSHTVDVRARDAAGNVDATPASRTWTIDTTAPDTSFSSGPIGATATATPAFAFSSTETGSTFECRLDLTTWFACGSPQTLLPLIDGAHTFDVRATDAAGNVDPSPASRAFTVDTLAPDTAILSGPPEPTNDSTPTFAVSATEASATFQCQVDAGGWAACGATWTTSALADGAHSVAVRAIDPAGNVDGTPDGRTVTVDTGAPGTAIDSGPSGTTNDRSATLAFSSPDPATFDCRLDGGTWAACVSPVSYSGLAAGSHTFAVRARDAAGNADATPASRTWTIDTTAPDTSIDSGPSGPTRSATPAFAFSASKAGASFSCRVDGGSWSACTSPLTLAALADGPHTFDVRATDAVGNVDPTPASRGFTVDTAAPDTSIDSGPTGTVSSRTATLAFSSADSGARFECKLDGGSWAGCSSPYASGSLGDGSHTFSVRAIDAAGNVDASPASQTWTVAGPTSTDYTRAVNGTSGLISYWRLGERSGTTAADATGTNDGADQGGATLGATGAIVGDSDTAVSLDGTSGKVAIPSSASLNPAAITVEAWINPDASATPGPRTIAAKSGQYRLSVDGARMSFEVDTTREPDGRTATSYDTGAVAPTGWRYVVATFDGYNAMVFVNGVRVAEQRVVGAAVADPANHPSVLGSTSNPLVLGDGFAGGIDEVAEYNRAITPLEVESHYRAGGGTSTHGAACWDGFGGFGNGSWPAGCWRPYADTSPFNRRIPSSPALDPNSSAIVSTLMSWGDPGFEGVPSQLNSGRVPSGDWGHATYYARASDPTYVINCTEDGRWGPCPDDGLRIHIPAAATPTGNGVAGMDHDMTVVDETTGWEYDFWGASQPSGTTLNMRWGGMTPVNGDGLASDGVAARYGMLAGIIRAPELAAGEIDHALFMTVNCVNSDDTPPAEAVYPALDEGQPCSWIGRDGTYAPRTGARFWLDISDAELATITPAWKRNVFRAMRDYGMIIGDTGGGTYGWGITMESDATYTSFGSPGQMEAFGRANGWGFSPTVTAGDMRMTRDFWASHLKVVDPCVSRGSCP